MAGSVALFASGFASDDKKPPAADRHAKITRERVRGEWRRPNQEILRISGKVRVKDANTLVFDDGTEVDVGGGMDAPDLEQKGQIGDSFYPCGKDAAEFLKKLIGDQTVTFLASGDQDRDAKRMRGHTLIGETSLEIEMIRNGWAISHHSGTTAWEIIARENKRGLWRGKFIEPEQWRKGDRLPGEKDAPAEDKKPQRTERQSKVVKEEVGPPDRKVLKITGKVKVLDAHAIQFEDKTEIELNGGMDAPDLEQKGRIGDTFYPCGKEAAEFLKKLIGNQEVTFYCESDKGNRLRGDCFVGETCLQNEMVRNGWAVSDHSGMDAWAMIAWENKRGLWRGEFISPKRWRKGERLPGEEDAAAEDKAAAALQEIGAKTKIEDSHVVSLYLRSDKVADATLEHLKKLPHLRFLNLAEEGNAPKITNAGLAHLAGLTKLKSLHLARFNGATDAGLVHLKGLTALETLEITHTKSIDGSGLVHLRELRRLESLNFNHTPVTDDTLAHVKDFTKLKSLGLRATKITDAGLKHLQALENLEQLNLWETNITDDGLALVAKMPQIKHLLLVAAEITADGLKHLENMPVLEDLELRHVKGDDDVVLEHVGRMAHLKRLEFHDMKATESGLKHLGKLTNLEVLLISGSRIPEAGFAHLKGLTGLKNLNLSKVPINDEGLAHLKGLTALEELHLTKTKVTDAGLVYLKGMTNLQTLGLMETQVSDAGLEQLAGLTKLRNVSLLHTRVTDEGVKKLKEALPKLDVYYR
jgi:endonuclease YncB( thermonuclease family)/Leucine-rich repeat (LRR) protein